MQPKSLKVSHKDQNIPSIGIKKQIRDLLDRYLYVRKRTEELIKPLEPEDLCIQGMADASPPKWHLAHTTWFFETFLLKPHSNDYKVANPKWSFLFNSYYDSIGDRHPRSQRSLLTRPGIDKILFWRKSVDKEVKHLLINLKGNDNEILYLVELGIQHEKQHQELLLMDLLDGFSRQPLEVKYLENSKNQNPVYQDNLPIIEQSIQWIKCKGGLVEIGANQNQDFLEKKPFNFDNESPSHLVWLQPFELCTQLVTNKQYLEFIQDKGYQRSEFWMSEGWTIKEERNWKAPRYWKKQTVSTTWNWEFTLKGIQPIEPLNPVRHISWFEADAYARWANARLPTEAEWEVAAKTASNKISQMHSELWQWTSSPYRPYPGFKLASGAIGEYNGKFMSSQFVLRGSSYLTPSNHGTNTYRNFFHPASRWIAAGIRLAR